MLARPSWSCFGAALAVAAVLVANAGCDQNMRGPSPRSDSPAPGGSASQAANEAADRGMYQAVNYRNAGTKGPAVVVLEGEIKSNNATFLQKITSNNIADYGELELQKANFKVLERNDLGGLKREFQIAYGAGDPDEARKLLGKGKFKATRWVVRFDVLKAEPVSKVKKGVNWGQVMQFAPGPHVGIETAESAGVWVIGMRYKVIDARTTEQAASGYFEKKMEVGSSSQNIAGFNREEEGGLTLDSLVQRLVQESVAEIDAKYK